MNVLSIFDEYLSAATTCASVATSIAGSEDASSAPDDLPPLFNLDAAHLEQEQSTSDEPSDAPVPTSDVQDISVPMQLSVSVLKISLRRYTYKSVPYFCLLVDDLKVLRRVSDDYVNGTKLFQVVATGLNKREVKGLLYDEMKRDLVGRGKRELSGVWIPLDRARYFVALFGKGYLVWPLLHDDPGVHVGLSFLADKNQSPYTKK